MTALVAEAGLAPVTNLFKSDVALVTHAPLANWPACCQPTLTTLDTSGWTGAELP